MPVGNDTRSVTPMVTVIPAATLEDRANFDEIIDVRSPAEFAQDHIPGALNCPVLSNDERHEVGLLYAQAPFEARKLGASLVAKNIAAMLQAPLSDRPKPWRPLVYCWRGGMRSQSAAVWFNLIGWRAAYLTGGYKTWRRYVVRSLETLPAKFSWRVICGATGSGKTRLLTALAQNGEQTLDLEALAAHRGSVFGDLPGLEQPTQRWFETCLINRMEGFSPEKTIYIEAESRNIGKRTLSNALLDAMRAAPCLEIQAPLEARLTSLLRDYAHLGDNPAALMAKLDRLGGSIDTATMTRWQTWAHERNLTDLFRELITRYYDPLYTRSQHKHFCCYASAQQLVINDLSELFHADVIARI